ncbi:transcriptional repressor [Eubacteriales bacterium OttesenSCG-928-M02]|nr:transcriptional repressor [Eubacteriales bacterium OttesenSCG-928-M02]
MQRRMTKQRKMVLHAIQNTTTHPSAEGVYAMVQGDNPEISLATVYRNLNLLAEDGVIRRLTTPDNAVHFDGNVEPHHHAICDECGAIVDVFCGNLDDAFYQEVYAYTGFIPYTHELLLYGRCAVCQNKLRMEETS